MRVLISILFLGLVSSEVSLAQLQPDQVSKISFDNVILNSEILNLQDQGFPNTFIEINGVPIGADIFRDVSTGRASNKEISYGPRDGAQSLNPSVLEIASLSAPFIRLYQHQRRSILFDGTNLSPSTGVTYNYTNGWSLSIWVRPKRMDVYKNVILHKGLSADPFNSNDFMLWYSGVGESQPGHIHFAATAVGGVNEVKTSSNSSYPVIDNKKWTHIAVTCGNSGLRMYRDGTLVDSQSSCPFQTKNHSDSGGRLSFGSVVAAYDPINGTVAPTSRDFQFAGAVDEYEVFEKELSVSEIENLSAQGFFFQLDFDEPVEDWRLPSYINPKALVDKSGADSKVVKQGNIYHFPGFQGNVLGLWDAGVVNNGNYLITQDINLVGRTEFSMGFSIRNRAIQEGTKIFSQMVELENASRQGVFEVELTKLSPLNINIYRAHINVGGVIHELTTSAPATVGSTAFSMFTWDGYCLKYWFNGKSSGVANPTDQICPVDAEGPPQPVGGVEPGPALWGAGYQEVAAEISVNHFLRADLDNLFFHEDVINRPDSICLGTGGLPQTLNETIEPPVGPEEVVTFEWEQYNGAPSSQYSIELESLSQTAGFNTTVTAICELGICRVSINFPYSLSGPDYRWRVQVVDTLGACLNTNPSLWRNFTYTGSFSSMALSLEKEMTTSSFAVAKTIATLSYIDNRMSAYEAFINRIYEKRKLRYYERIRGRLAATIAEKEIYKNGIPVFAMQKNRPQELQQKIQLVKFELWNDISNMSQAYLKRLEKYKQMRLKRYRKYLERRFNRKQVSSAK